MSAWPRNEKIALISLLFVILGSVATVAVVPEVRYWLGLSTKAKDEPQINTSPPISGNSATSTTSTGTQPVSYGKVIDAGDPFPIGYNKAKPGTPISLLQSLYPGGQYTSNSYQINPQDGPFSLISFFHNGDKADPELAWITFYFRDSNVKPYIHEQALSAFGADAVVSKAMGQVLEWPNIKGYKVEIKGWYSVSKSSPSTENASK